MFSAFERTQTESPFSAAVTAAESPEMPEPTTMRSYLVLEFISPFQKK
jgi:hypothetical protein